MLQVRISIRARCTTLCDEVWQWLATGRWFSPVSSRVIRMWTTLCWQSSWQSLIPYIRHFIKLFLISLKNSEIILHPWVSCTCGWGYITDLGLIFSQSNLIHVFVLLTSLVITSRLRDDLEWPCRNQFLSLPSKQMRRLSRRKFKLLDICLLFVWWCLTPLYRSS
jgi:hypothetical protein